VSARQLRWLLIGNSRWHWALDEADGQGGERAPQFLHLPPQAAAVDPPVAWAAVGPVPPEAALPAETRLALQDVPLAEAPPWLGIDRALAGWWAARLTGSPVLVADAGTVLSLTLVDGRGRFAGGRLMAGAALQLGAMGSGTEGLPCLERGLASAVGGEAWPRATEAAMRQGVAEGLAAAVLEAGRQALALDAGCRIVLTGGDGSTLLPLLRRAAGMGEEVLLHRPELCLEALVALRSRPPVGAAQARPRSSRI
jgi:type III pantothenate kinase